MASYPSTNRNIEMRIVLNIELVGNGVLIE